MNRCLKPILLLSILLFYKISNGQTDSSSVPISGFAIKFLPSGLVDITHAVYAMSYEQAISKSISINLEAGFIGKSLSIRINDNRNPSQLCCGFLFRPSLRFYSEKPLYEQKTPSKSNNAGGSTMIKNQSFLFMEVQPFFKSVYGGYSGWIPINCGSQILGYQRKADFEYNKIAYGLTLLVGVTEINSVFNLPTHFEVYLGLGIRRKDFKTWNLPENGCVPEELEGIFGLQKAWLPNFQFGIRLGLLFKQKRS